MIQVRVITSPGEFYEELVTQTRNATQRITLSSLYLGTGHLEQQLVSSFFLGQFIKHSEKQNITRYDDYQYNVHIEKPLYDFSFENMATLNQCW